MIVFREYWVIYSLNGYLRFMYFTERLSPERATRDRFIISANATDWTTLRCDDSSTTPSSHPFQGLMM